MATSPKKSRWGRRIFFSILGLFLLAPVVLYLILTSPRFLQWSIDKVNHIIPGQIVYEDLQFHLAEGELGGRGLKYLTAQGEPAVALESLDLDFYWPALFVGKLDIKKLQMADLEIDLGKFPKKKKPSNWRKVLQLISKRISINESRITPVKLTLREGAVLELNGLNVELSRQILGEQQIHLHLDRTLLTEKEKTFSAEDINFSGFMEIPVLREFNFFVKKAKGGLKMEGIALPGIEGGGLQTQFFIDGDRLIFKQGELKTADGTLSLELEFDSNKPALNLKLKNQSPITFKAIPRASENLTQTFTAFQLDLEAAVAGKSLKELNGSIDLKLDAKGNPAHDKTPDHHLSLKGKLKQGALQFTLFEITSEKMNLKGEGVVDFAGQNFDVKVKTQNFDVTTLVNTLAELDLSGYADAEGTITGPFRRPNFNLTARAKEAGYSFLNFGEINGVFKIQDGDLSFEGGSPAGNEAFTKVKVVVKDLYHKTRRTTLTSEFRNLEADKLLLNENFQGKVTGTFDMQAEGGKESGKLQARIDSFGLYGFEFEFLEATGALTDNQFILKPVTFQPKDYEILKVPDPVVLKFDDHGWSLGGILLPGIAMEGKFQKSKPTHVNLDVTLQNADLKPVLASRGLPVRESRAEGKIAMQLGVDDNPTSIDILLDRLDIPLEEGALKNDGKIEVTIKPPRVEFRKARFLSGNSGFQVAGSYTLEGPLDLRVEGDLNLDLLPLLVPKMFRDGEGSAKMDLKVGGTADKPHGLGSITFENAGLSLRPVRGQVENLNGSLKFTPQGISFENIRGTMREGDLIVNGKIALNEFKPGFYDLTIDTREVALSEPGVYKIIFSGTFILKGPADRALLSGTMDINDGVYSRDFNLTQSLLKAETPAVKEPPPEFLKDIQLDLQIRSPGELAVKNNIARIFFKSDLKVTGPATKPKIGGAMEVLDGEFHYFTVDFQGATGTIDFRNPDKGPYVDITLSKNYQSAFSDITAYVTLEGFTDNLQVNFSSNPPLERRDLMALVFTGVLPGDARRNLSGTNLASTVIASQLSQVIEKPLAKTAHLDIFRLEATDPDQTAAISRLVVGKRLTDRLSLEFKTDLGVDKPLQGVQMEYLLLDNILLKATQFNDGEFDFNLALRFALF